MIKVSQVPAYGLLPGVPLTLMLHNYDSQVHGGTVRVFIQGSDTAIGEAGFADLQPNGDMSIEVALSGASDVVVADNEWPVRVEVYAEGEVAGVAQFNADFVGAVRASSPLVIDGDMSEWADALPLHIDLAEYAKGSFANSWSPDDLSGVSYCQWDEDNLYFAAVVTDQLFNQGNVGGAIWMHDSIQLSFARNVDSARTEFGLALTKVGPEVYRFSGPTGTVDAAELAVAVLPNQTIYECRIPWSELAGLGPEPGLNLRFAILLNDDDTLVPRRFLERFGGIAHGKAIEEHGHLVLLP
jgi:hypothetical protein